MFREADDDEADLDWNFVDRFPDQGREEEGRKLDLEVPTHKASEVEEWVRDLNVGYVALRKGYIRKNMVTSHIYLPKLQSKQWWTHSSSAISS